MLPSWVHKRVLTEEEKNKVLSLRFEHHLNYKTLAVRFGVSLRYIERLILGAKRA
jgi:DNA-directed RNA polymerase specialized sigma subunit